MLAEYELSHILYIVFENSIFGIQVVIFGGIVNITD